MLACRLLCPALTAPARCPGHDARLRNAPKLEYVAARQRIRTKILLESRAWRTFVSLLLTFC
ncbi:hypothetical protein CO2235_U500004 [Cupriavidus oxalaticus]|uniref:Uncharacterized protein n=1 Tax=Cupriavidus oxalaticus TaxID=96344 RepID=A0A375FN06_9BURK|nr:hypothetical protein CO2235_U500004 [Cupriavidus oxalaticus]